MRVTLLLSILGLTTTLTDAAAYTSLPSFRVNAFSNDGSVAVGSTGNIASVYTSEHGVTAIGTFPEADFPQSSATAVSADGSVVVGYSRSNVDNEAFRWTRDGGLEKLKDLTGYGAYGPGDYTSGGTSSSHFTNASYVSRNGEYIVGFGGTSVGQEAFVWSQENGFAALGDIPGDDGVTTSTASLVTNSGSSVFGIGTLESGPGSVWQPTIWDAERILTVPAIEPNAQGRYVPVTLSVDEQRVLYVDQFSGGLVEYNLTSAASETLLESDVLGIVFFEVFSDGDISAIVLGEGDFVYDRISDSLVSSVTYLTQKGVILPEGTDEIRLTAMSGDGLTFAGITLDEQSNTTDWFIAQIPEPSTFPLALGLLALLSGIIRRR